MKQPLLGGFIIGVVLISLSVAAISIFMSELNASYPATYDNESLAVYNQLSNLSNLAEETKNQTLDIESDSGIFDIVGRLSSGAFGAVKTAVISINVFDTIRNQAMQDARIGDVSLIKILNIAIITIVIVIISLIIVSAIFKWRLI